MYYIGGDLGTSALKLLLVDENGNIINSESVSYPISFPNAAWSEQNPHDWWIAFNEGISKLCANIDRHKVKGIGISGQMHGLVALDENDTVIRPAILWNDSRSEKEVDYLNNVVGKNKMSQYTGNIAYAGFTAPKLLWMKNNEPELFKRIKKIMLPKDYINYLLTGNFVTDYSDASGLLLLDVKNKCWSKEMLDICEITSDQLPELHESYDNVGTIKKEVAYLLNLDKDVIVAAGAGDNAGAAIGTNTLKNGMCNISLGTSGTIFISNDNFHVDSLNSLHSFAHSNGKYHLMACMLSAASCNKWFAEEVIHNTDYQKLQSEIDNEDLGNNNVYFLPYLMGERSPINDTDARACFLGMSMDTKQKDIYQAVLEGVCFACRDNFEVAKKLGVKIDKSSVCGGGAKSKLWLRMLANILNIELVVPAIEEGPSYGGAILAMVANNEYSSVEECAEKFFNIKEIISPNSELVARYERQYQKYGLLYPSLKEVFNKIR